MAEKFVGDETLKKRKFLSRFVLVFLIIGLCNFSILTSLHIHCFFSQDVGCNLVSANKFNMSFGCNLNI
jgi:hypothetical protein